MGAACGCGGQAEDDRTQIGGSTYSIPANGVTLDKRHYTAKDIYWIVRLQAIVRGVRARIRVQKIREALFHPGYNEGYKGEDYENVNVQVSSLNLTAI